MQFEGEFDEAVDQLWIGQPGSFPQLGIHTDAGESGNGVEFIDKTCEGLFAKLHNPMNNLTAKTEGSHKPCWNAQAGVPV